MPPVWQELFQIFLFRFADERLDFRARTWSAIHANFLLAIFFLDVRRASTVGIGESIFYSHHELEA